MICRWPRGSRLAVDVRASCGRRLWPKDGTDHAGASTSAPPAGALRAPVRGGGALYAAAPNCGIWCDFWDIDWDQMRQLMRHVWGREATQEELEKVGERASNLGRIFNLREDLNARDGIIPRRFLTEPFKMGASAGWVIGEDAFAAALAEYYVCMVETRTAYPPRPSIDVRL